MRRILGIDPGLRCTGFGIVEHDARGLHSSHGHVAARYVASGVIRSGEGSLAQRIGRLHQGTLELIDEFRPDLAVCEIVFVNVNPQSTLLLGQARGAVIAAMANRGLQVHEYTALQVKQGIVGHGRATKAQMQAMVQRMLALNAAPATDAADALACAMCHLQVARFGQMIGSHRRRSGRAIRPGVGR